MGGVATIERARAAVTRRRTRPARRVANARLARGAGDREVRLACECRDDACEATLTVSAARYRRATRGGRRYVVRPGHDRDAEDVVVESHRLWAVVGAPPSELFLG